MVAVGDEYKLAGLVSWGSSNCNTYGAYTRISNFESWISSKTGIEISYVPPVPTGDSIVCQGVVSSQYHSVTIAGASSYEWQLLPADAGTIKGNAEQADVTWIQSYSGPAKINLRVVKYGIVSYWTALTVHIAKHNNLISQSNDTVICAGQPVVLQVESEGYNLKYSWFKDDYFMRTGTSPYLSIIKTTKDSSGIYRCNITGSCGDVFSPEISLTVLPVTAIGNISPDKQAVFGENVTLAVIADGHNLLYQWHKDGVILPEETASQLVLQNVNASNTGLYSVLTSGSCGEELSRKVYIYVQKNENHSDPEIFVWPTVVTSEFRVALSNDQTYDLKLYNTAGNLMREKPDCEFDTTINISDFPQGVYILTISGENFSKSVKLIRNKY